MSSFIGSSGRGGRVVVGGAAQTKTKVALIMGVANQRSIAWSCVQAFLQRTDTNWRILLSYQHDDDKTRSKIQSLIMAAETGRQRRADGVVGGSRILGAFPCDVTDDASVKTFFHEALPEALHRCYHQDESGRDDLSSPVVSSEEPQLNAVIHSIAFAPELKRPLLETTRHAFLTAHEISAYSLIQVARESLPYMTTYRRTTAAAASSTANSSSTTTLSPLDNDTQHHMCGGGHNTTSITTLSYLGAARAIPGYNVMGPAKASLESVVRGLALEMGGGGQQNNNNSSIINVRVNAVRAGPIPTLSSKGGIANFDSMRRDVEKRAPLGRNVSAEQVASTVYHVAAEAEGMTGQTIDVDGGYSVVAGPISSMEQIL